MGRRADSARSLVDRLRERGREQRLAKATSLFHQGDTAREIFCLVTGRVRLDRHLESGHVATVAVVRGPSLLAEAALFSDRYRCSAVTEIDCTVCRVSKPAVLDRLERDPGFALDFIRSVVSDVRELRTRLELRNVRPASERLLQYLQLQADHGRPTGDRPLSALASELGLSAEALYRIVARLEKEGRLRRAGRNLVRIS